MDLKEKKHSLFGRPRSAVEDKRSVKFTVFCTPSEADEIKRKCAELSMTSADFFRRAGLSRKIQARRSMVDSQTLDELRSIGQNINQIARELTRARTASIAIDDNILTILLQNQLKILNEMKLRIFDQE